MLLSVKSVDSIIKSVGFKTITGIRAQNRQELF